MLTLVVCFLLCVLACALVIENARLTAQIERIIPGLCALLLAVQLNALQFGVAGGTALTLLEMGTGVWLTLSTSLSSILSRIMSREEF